MSDDLKFRHTFSCIKSVPSSSGKTSFVKRLLQIFHDLCTEPTFADGIVWCYGEKSALPCRLPADDTYNEGVPEFFGSSSGEPNRVILDDLSNDVYSKQVCELFTRGSHHRNISVILITQKLFHQGRFCSDISLNPHYIMTLKNVGDKKYFLVPGQSSVPRR